MIIIWAMNFGENQRSIHVFLKVKKMFLYCFQLQFIKAQIFTWCTFLKAHIFRIDFLGRLFGDGSKSTTICEISIFFPNPDDSFAEGCLSQILIVFFLFFFFKLKRYSVKLLDIFLGYLELYIF